MPIQQLPSSVINKIAAGEVIERPASVVKELLENSVDAGATHIEVTIEQGGIELIRIVDNGSGIPRDELTLAVTSHATSKIVDADDLFRVGTFGFRGEALASICEVSQAMIRSKTENQECGFELLINGGHHEPIAPCGGTTGTTMEIRQLFYNTPVRQKFLRTPQTEKGHIAEAFARVALANPQIAMTLTHNTTVVHHLPATESWRERISAFFGAEISDNLISVSDTDGAVQVSGFVVDPSVSRSNNRMQYLFLNRRYIRDRSLQHALSESYRGLLMVGRYPACFLRLAMPPEDVDVNVHPAKLEVRFRNGGQIYKQLLSTIRNRFLTTDLTAKGQLGRRDGGQIATAVGNNDSMHSTESGSAAVAIQDRLTFPPATSAANFAGSPVAPRTSVGFGPPSIPGSNAEFRPYPDGPSVAGSMPAESAAYSSNPLPPVSSATGVATGEAPVQRMLALQVHNTYLISETEEGMVIIDQHALHERIIYEQLRDRILGGDLESQRLLVPEPVTLPPAEAAAVLDAADTLARIGIAVEPFGGDTVLVSSYPAMLANHNPADMLKSVVEKIVDEAGTPEERDVIDELLHMISCKAAVKAGDRLSPEEITSLLEHRELCQDAHHCPHGRPTSLVFSRQELDKRFKRI